MTTTTPSNDNDDRNVEKNPPDDNDNDESSADDEIVVQPQPPSSLRRRLTVALTSDDEVAQQLQRQVTQSSPGMAVAGEHVMELEFEEWDGSTPFYQHCLAGSLAGVAEHRKLLQCGCYTTYYCFTERCTLLCVSCVCVLNFADTLCSSLFLLYILSIL